MEEIEKINQELRLAKQAAKEWISRLEGAEGRVAAIWDAAIFSAKTRIGRHEPRCVEGCYKCWAYDELGKMARGDPGNYSPIKDRARAKAQELKRACRLTGKLKPAYCQGVSEMLAVVEEMLADKE